jgi:8-oxo-dGTP pyrophosphatase MutT (NUDIX family)
MRWTVHGERILYESPWVRLAIADVELPDGDRIEHDVVRVPREAALALVHDPGRGLLMLRRHRFITDSWGWEAPGGEIDDGETPVEAAERETLEETGWRPGPTRHLFSYFPMNGRVDQRFHVVLADGAEHVGPPADRNEADRVEWLPVERVRDLIRTGEISDGYSLTALLYALDGGFLV